MKWRTLVDITESNTLQLEAWIAQDLAANPRATHDELQSRIINRALRRYFKWLNSRSSAVQAAIREVRANALLREPQSEIVNAALEFYASIRVHAPRTDKSSNDSNNR